MFSGIIESTAKILTTENADQALRVFVARPVDFSDLKIGDSIAVNGVCLTVECFDSEKMQFTLGYETLQILNIRMQEGDMVNLERSLRFGDRIHGHLVSGHVDSLGSIVDRKKQGESLLLKIKVQNSILPFLWHKGSITIHGVSLTINNLFENVVEVCLIPETLKRTNLALLQMGDTVHIEPDYFAKSMLAHLKGAHANSSV